MTNSSLHPAFESEPKLKNENWHLVPEYAPQVAVMVAWPHENTDWAEILPEAQANFAELIAAISLAATPWVLIPSIQAQTQIQEKIQQVLTARDWHQKFGVEYSVVPYNDTWTRDYGPLCVFKASEQIGQKHLRIQDFIFNGWGNKFDAALDTKVNQNLWDNGEFERVYTSKLDQEKLFSVQLKQHEIVMEGGSLETNGSVLLTTKACLLNPNRNPELTQANLEAMVAKQFGTLQSIWLKHGHLEGDDTDAHIDTLARFAAKDVIIYQGCKDESDSHYANLKLMQQELEKLAAEHNFTLIELPWPDAVYDGDRRLPATYANFLILNNHLLLPTYGCDADEQAVSLLKENLPEMTVIPVNCTALIYNNGSLHCSTMQLPHIWTNL